jgi:hypothetical protein
MMTESRYNFLLWQFISASDSGEYDELTADEVHAYARDEKIDAFLKVKFPDLDFSLLDDACWKDVRETWSSISNAVDYSRKFGVQKRGLSLLMAYTLQSMQQLESRKAA